MTAGESHPHAPAPPVESPWRNFRRLMWAMAVLTVIVLGATLAYMMASGAPMRLHFVIALGGGIILTLGLSGALMGLAFLSNRTGHDADVGRADPNRPESGG